MLRRRPVAPYGAGKQLPRRKPLSFMTGLNAATGAANEPHCSQHGEFVRFRSPFTEENSDSARPSGHRDLGNPRARVARGAWRGVCAFAAPFAARVHVARDRGRSARHRVAAFDTSRERRRAFGRAALANRNSHDANVPVVAHGSRDSGVHDFVRFDGPVCPGPGWLTTNGANQPCCHGDDGVVSAVCGRWGRMGQSSRKRGH